MQLPQDTVYQLAQKTRLANGHSSVFVEDKTLIFGSKVIFVGYNAARGNLVSQSPALPHRAPRHSPHTFLEAA